MINSMINQNDQFLEKMMIFWGLVAGCHMAPAPWWKAPAARSTGSASGAAEGPARDSLVVPLGRPVDSFPNKLWGALGSSWGMDEIRGPK